MDWETLQYVKALAKKYLKKAGPTKTVKVGCDSGDGAGVVKFVKNKGGKANVIKSTEDGDWVEITATKEIIDQASDYAGGFVGSY